MNEIKPFKRSLYYSQTDVQSKFKLSAQRVKNFITAHNIPVVENKVTMFYPGGTGSYQLTTRYVLKDDWHKVMPV
jgi:alpha-D-ribose 1-methylphosphonate 5-phosphate C-P lyase